MKPHVGELEDEDEPLKPKKQQPIKNNLELDELEKKIHADYEREMKILHDDLVGQVESFKKQVQNENVHSKCLPSKTIDIIGKTNKDS